MPQCIIECSSELSNIIKFDLLVRKLHDSLESFEYFSEGSVKVRLLMANHYLIAGGKENFIHVLVKMFPGRTLEQRRNITNQMTKELCIILPTVDIITVEVQEIDIDTHSNKDKIKGN